MKGAIARAEEMIAETAGSWMPQQFENPANLEVHRRTTAQEILARLRAIRPIDVLITGVGTGGHITACAEVLKAEWPEPARCSRSSRPCRRSSPAASPARTRSRASAPASSPAIMDIEPARRHHPGRSGRRQGDGPPRARARKGMLVGISSGATLPRSSRSWPRSAPASASSASTTTPASAISRCPDFLPEMISRGAARLGRSRP